MPRKSDPTPSSLDTLSPAERSERMGRVRGKDTAPELRVRRLAHALGYRYRLHRKDLPGRPDLVFGDRRKVIFVHGCFWHRHPGCPRARFPKSPERAAFWREKLLGNARRDKRNQRDLKRLGWQVLVIWECDTENQHALERKLRRFLG
jgi:DNA mismatch endonuclease (patch repair protein)